MEDNNATLHFPDSSAVLVIHTNGDVEALIPQQDDPNAQVEKNVLLLGAILKLLKDEEAVASLLNEFHNEATGFRQRRN